MNSIRLFAPAGHCRHTQLRSFRQKNYITIQIVDRFKKNLYMKYYLINKAATRKIMQIMILLYWDDDMDKLKYKLKNKEGIFNLE